VKVCVDIQAAVTQQAGVGRYTRMLIRHLAEQNPGDELFGVYFDFRGGAAPPALSGARPRAVRWCPGRVAQACWRILKWPPFDAFAGRADVYHFPNFVLPPLKRGKSVVTIHDMSFLRFPEFAEERNRRRLVAGIRDTAARADAIVTISEFSAREISELLSVRPDRIFPIHLGVSQTLKPAAPDDILGARRRLGIDRPYLLTVGTLEPRKNVPFLIDVFETLTDFDGDLVIAGGLGWKYEPILERIRRSPKAGAIRVIGHADDELLCPLYSGAQAFLCTSFYEGFGLPPLEAMACGAPVISSTGGSLSEVLGDGAVLLARFEADRWAAEIRRVLHDTAARTGLIERGRRQAAKYQWADTARRTWEIYKKVAG
jgi:glycosyltransferase involved in cell wall biosynthesis